MAGSNPPDQATLAQAFATIASAFTVNQSGVSAQCTAITNSPVTVAVNSPAVVTAASTAANQGAGSSSSLVNTRSSSRYSHFSCSKQRLVHHRQYVHRDYAAVKILPSYLRRRRDVLSDSRQPKKAKVTKHWDRDVFCLPQGKGASVLSFPRGKYRTDLVKRGLMGKLHMTSDMDEEDLALEIRSIFKGPMKNNPNFQFQYLQSTGGGSKSLSVPAQSSSFKWTPHQVSRLSAQSGTIYILAVDELDLKDTDYEVQCA